jgi:predicted RNase H-like nuclease
MQVAGIDLAWGTKARTGLALTDENGRLVKSASVISDADIVAFLAGSTPVVIAIDAPIVVRNSTGMRECERLLSADYRRFHAGTHPTNMGRPSMQPEPRAMALTRRYGWHVETTRSLSKNTQVAIEVYPHSAMVGLFGLARILEYKAKSGRTVDSRRQEFHALMDLMEAHCDGTLHLSQYKRWREIRHVVLTAKQQAALNLLEDEVDAIFCAYIAWTFAVAPELLSTYGTPGEGAIVTFPPPIH